MSISVEKITKIYGTQKALDEVSFEIKKGEIVGFLGPNGAGKSTLMKILTTYLQPNEGIAKVGGFATNEHPEAIQKMIGYLPEHNPLYLDLYVREYLEFCRGIHQVSKSNIDQVIQKTGLTPESHKKISALSKGYRQRVGLAAALLHDPEVLILDEPTTGLDPNQLVEIRQLIQEVGKNKTVFLSTHIMQEVEAMCDRVIIINQGKIVTDKSLKSLLKEEQKQTLLVEFDQPISEEVLFEMSILVQVKAKENNQWLLEFQTQDDPRVPLFDFAASKGYRILQLQTSNKNLETIFREKTKKSKDK